LGGVNAVCSGQSSVRYIIRSRVAVCKLRPEKPGQAGGRTHILCRWSNQFHVQHVGKGRIFRGFRPVRETINGTIEIIDADAYFVLSGVQLRGSLVTTLKVSLRIQAAKPSGYPIENSRVLGESYRGYEIAFTAFLKTYWLNRQTGRRTWSSAGNYPSHDHSGGEF